MVEFHYVELKKAIPAGANNIGSVTIVGLPALVTYRDAEKALPVIDLRDLAAIYERATFRWINDYTCSGALEIVTTAGFYLNTAPGVVLYVTSIDLEILTANKWCCFEFGTTDAPDAGGVFTPRTPCYLLDRGVASTTGTFVTRFWTIPIDIRYDVADCRSVTMRVQGQDAATHVMMAFKGYKIY